jgi:hypothetical protein
VAYLSGFGFKTLNDFYRLSPVSKTTAK